MKKRTSRLILSLLSFLSFGVPAFSQSSSLSGVKAQLDLMFAGLDKTKIPTGFLWDTSANRVQTIVIPIHPLITPIPLEM